MKSLIAIPDNGITDVVLTTTLQISETGNFDNPIYEQQEDGDVYNFILDESFTNIPLFIQVIKALDTGDDITYTDTVPVTRGETFTILEENYNGLSNITIENISSTTEESIIRVTLDRSGVDRLKVVVYRTSDRYILNSGSINDNSLEITINNREIQDSYITIVAVSSIATMCL